MQDTGHIKEQAQHDINQQILTRAIFEKDSDRWQQDCQNDQDSFIHCILLTRQGGQKFITAAAKIA
jgi:hypothetical protein